MDPSELERDHLFQSKLRQGIEQKVLSLGLWPLTALPPSVMELHDLRGIALGAVRLEVEDGRVVRNEWMQSDDYRMQRPWQDLSQLGRLAGLEYVDVSCCRAIADLSPLQALPRLKGLYLLGNQQVTDFSPITAIESLEELDVTETGLTDYSQFAGLPQLRKVILFGKRGTADLSTLAALPHLEELLIIGDSSWTDLSFLTGLATLQRLKVRKLKAVADWSPVASLPQLRQLYIVECPGLTKFAPLQPLLPQLESLFMQQELSDLPIKHQSEDDYSRRRGVGWLNCVEKVRKYCKPGRKKPPTTKSDVPAVPDSLFVELRTAVRNAVLERIESGEFPTTSDGLYAVGVFVHLGDGGWVTLCHRTLEGLESPGSQFSPEDLAELGLTPDDTQDDEESESSHLSQKWSPAEWGTSESIADAEWKAILKAYHLKKLNEKGREAAYAEIGVRAPAAVILGLRDLDRDGAFGPPENRESLTLLAGLIDDEENPETLSQTVAVRFLNPESVAERFLHDWKAMWLEDGKTVESTEAAIAAARSSPLQEFLLA